MGLLYCCEYYDCPGPWVGAVMKRREFITVVGGVAAWSLAARGEQATPSRIGFLRVGPPPPTYIGGFREGLQEQGLVEGRDFVIEYALAQSAVQIRKRQSNSHAPSLTLFLRLAHLLSSRPETPLAISL